MAGLTQEELAARCDISRNRLVYLEGGYQVSRQEEERILEVIRQAVEANSASIRRFMDDRAAKLATA